MEKPLVSVIIPCFNQGQYLEEAIDSVRVSTYKNVEIIVVDDGSTQNLDIINSFSESNIKVIHQENQGIAAARNNGIKQANGKYILPLDADDKIHPTYIEKALKLFENNEKLGIVYSKTEFFGDKQGEWKIEEYKFPDILWGNSIFCSAIYKKSDWEKVGGYKKEMLFGFEDWEFWLSLIETGAEVYRIPEVLFCYRQHSNSRSENLSKNNDGIGMIQQIIKLHPDLYADNMDKILLPLYKIFGYYSPRNSFRQKLRYKLTRILVDVIIKTENAMFDKKKIGKIENGLKKTKIVCVFNNKEIFEKVVKNNDNLKDSEISFYDNTLENISITSRYNDFIEKNSDSIDSWFVFIHQDFGFMENPDFVTAKLDENYIYGAIGTKIYKGIFFGKKGQDLHYGFKSNMGVTYGEIHQGKNDFNFKPYGKRIFLQKTVESIDCCCIMIHSSLIKKYNLRFDENLKFHMYAEELCYSAKKNYKIKTKVIQMECFHLGHGVLNEEYKKSVEYLKNKFKIKKIPSTCPN